MHQQQLLFPSHSSSYYTTSSGASASSLNRAIRSEEYSVRNRLRSIADDRSFVADTVASYPALAVLANLRCGRWYCSDTQQRTVGECYFKSTDGHAHHFKFSASRLNTHLLHALIDGQAASAGNASNDAASASPSAAPAPSVSPRCTGAMIVDSTRKGKRFPDSFTRTLPIWCAVWNRAIAEFKRIQAHSDNSSNATDSAATAANPPWDTALHMPSWISPMECDEIEGKLPEFVRTLLDSGVDIAPIARGLNKPLRCLWMDRTSAGWPGGDAEFHLLPFTPILLLQCSRVESETRGIGQRQGWSYIQGAGDDEENWTDIAGIKGFTPAHLTEHAAQIASFDHEADVIECIRDILAAEASKHSSAPTNLQLHHVKAAGCIALECASIPSRAAVVKHFSSSDPVPPLSLLFLYFDASLAVKLQRKSKLSADQERARLRHAGAEEADEEDEGAEVVLETAEAEDAPIDLLDWTVDQALSVPISSLPKSRRALLDALAPSLSFLSAQRHLGRTVVVCEDLSHISCVITAAILTPAPTVDSSSGSTAPLAADRRSNVDKALIRSTLTAVQAALPPHFPSRLLMKQLNQFFAER